MIWIGLTEGQVKKLADEEALAKQAQKDGNIRL